MRGGGGEAKPSGELRSEMPPIYRGRGREKNHGLGYPWWFSSCIYQIRTYQGGLRS